MIDEGGWLLNGKGANRPLLVLAHGAGAGYDTPFMTRMAEMIASHGIMVARFEFTYMRRRRETGKRAGPGRAEGLMGEYEERIRQWADRATLFIGGKSMGGRIASMLVDRLHEEGLVRGLVCLGYPFHPPGRPENLRIDHLKSLRTPALICQGDRDSFGRCDEVETWNLSPSIRFRWLPDGDHDFKPRVKSGETWAGNLEAAARTAVDFIHEMADG